MTQPTSYVYAASEVQAAKEAGLLCCACAQPFVDPRMHLPCRSAACNTCFTTACPACKQSVSSTDLTVMPAFVTARLDALKVHCPACNKTLARVDFAEHVGDCPCPCPRGCGERVPPSQRAAHDQECGAYPAACGAFACEAVVSRKQLAAHRATCPLVKVEPATRALQQMIEQLRAQRQQQEARLLQQEARLLQLEARLAEVEAALNAKSSSRRTRNEHPRLSALDVIKEKRRGNTPDDQNW